MVQKQQGICMAITIILYFFVTPDTKINLRRMVDFIVKGKTIKFLGEKVFNLGLHRDFLDETPNMTKKAIFFNLDFIKRLLLQTAL